ncbi:MAG: phasin family protein [bacterium]|jgi:poly(hydroxyalkanoate) granule-associated protein
MVKKIKTQSSDLNSTQLAQAVRDSAKEIWLAGLGAFAKAQEEGQKVFSTLVKEGTSLQKKTRHYGDEKIAEVTGNVSKTSEKISKQAAGTWDRLEQIFEDRVARALNSLGVPSGKEIAILSARVESLTREVQRLNAATSTPAQKPPVKKTSRVRTTAPSVRAKRARKAA